MVSNYLDFMIVSIFMIIGMVILFWIELKLIIKNYLYKDYIKEYKLQKHFYEWKKYNKNL